MQINESVNANHYYFCIAIMDNNGYMLGNTTKRTGFSR